MLHLTIKKVHFFAFLLSRMVYMSQQEWPPGWFPTIFMYFFIKNAKFPSKWHTCKISLEICFPNQGTPLKIHTSCITGFFSEGAKSFFLIFFPGVKCFFPVETFHFGRPKTNFRHFEKWKAKKKSPLLILALFPPSISIFHLPFTSPFYPLFHFFLASFFPIGQQKFPSQNFLGGHTAPLPPCYTTDSHSLCGRFFQIIYMGGVDFKWNSLFNNLFLLKCIITQFQFTITLE